MNSRAKHLGRIELPAPSGVRVQMMPFLVHDVRASLPAELASWERLLVSICAFSGARGVGYLTIDEAELRRGDYHRRPGMHVDCGGEQRHGGGGPTKPHAAAQSGGMYLIASVVGARGWCGDLLGRQGWDGECDHLRAGVGRAFALEAAALYWASSTFLHETTPVRVAGTRQFVRVSMPSDAPWFADSTPNPLGVLPGGPVVASRPVQMGFRP